MHKFQIRKLVLNMPYISNKLKMLKCGLNVSFMALYALVSKNCIKLNFERQISENCNLTIFHTWVTILSSRTAILRRLHTPLNSIQYRTTQIFYSTIPFGFKYDAQWCIRGIYRQVSKIMISKHQNCVYFVWSWVLVRYQMQCVV